MTLCRALVTFPAASADSEDIVVNTWHFDLASTDEGGTTDATTALDAFYTSFITSLSASHTWASGRIKWYDLTDPEPRAPIHDTGFAISGTASANQLPRECSICVSFQGDQVSGVSQARRRGRIYLGPWGTGANNTSGMVASSLVTTLATACGTLLSASEADADYQWVVYSRTTGLAVPVTNGWVDDAWDTQRRRGVDATTRTVFV